MRAYALAGPDGKPVDGFVFPRREDVIRVAEGSFERDGKRKSFFSLMALWLLPFLGKQGKEARGSAADVGRVCNMGRD